MEEFSKPVVKASPGLCRCCLSEGCYKDLTAEYPWMSETEVYADMLLQCFDISVSQQPEGPDGANNLICEVCITRLRDASHFKKQVQLSEHKFINMMLHRRDIQNKAESYCQEAEVETQLNCEVIIKEELTELEVGNQEDHEGHGDYGMQPQQNSDPLFSSNLQDSKYSEPTVTDDATRPFSCPVCSKTFLQNRYMKKHLGNHTGAKPYECPVCKKSFNSKSNLKRHSVIHGESKPFDCYICNKKFTQKCILTRHLLTHKEYRSFPCDECDKKFTNMIELTQHLKTHTALKEFICDTCNKKFAKKDHLIRHLTIHNRYRPYACDVCERRFNQKGQLQRHCLKIHSGKVFICAMCDIQFNAWFELSRHYRGVHRQTSFPCSMCDKTFTKQYDLKRHLHIHSGERPFSCNVCRKTFNRKCHYTAHMFKHSGDKPFACDVCHKRFSMKHHVAAHLATHTEKNNPESDSLAAIKCERKSQNTQTPAYPVVENEDTHFETNQLSDHAFATIKIEKE